MRDGVKDAFTQYWIEELIAKAWGMQKLQPSQPPREIQDELMALVDKNKPAIYNSFLMMPGALFDSFISLWFNTNVIPGFDASCDMPVEILHTILLGVVKYIWHVSHSSWTSAQQKVYSGWL